MNNILGMSETLLNSANFTYTWKKTTNKLFSPCKRDVRRSPNLNFTYYLYVFYHDNIHWTIVKSSRQITILEHELGN